MITKGNTKLLIRLTKVHQNYLKIKYAGFELLSVALLSTVIYNPRNHKFCNKNIFNNPPMPQICLWSPTHHPKSLSYVPVKYIGAILKIFRIFQVQQHMVFQILYFGLLIFVCRIGWGRHRHGIGKIREHDHSVCGMSVLSSVCTTGIKQWHWRKEKSNFCFGYRDFWFH